VCVGRFSEVFPGAASGDLEPLDALVWSFLYRGEFGPGSCGPAPLPGVPTPTCDSMAQPELRVILDYHSANFVVMGTPTGFR